ncbi:hypothetical protein C4K35_1802 [Pseudomonas chlororaphis subsp. piscium]|nr:hypothetical protein C4K35_1802 [Pseudomonas chlororaphis subsp. piscium]AZC56023.1 hypothetical protein C4K34_1847 [Pseudomonas chlororaphis subsp. piscium]
MAALVELARRRLFARVTGVARKALLAASDSTQRLALPALKPAA